MKNILFALFVLISSFSFADAWDNLTREQADAVVAELKENPFIFDYCDCCSSEGEYAATSHLMKVNFAAVVICPWNNDYYSIELKVEYICEVVHSKNETGDYELKVKANSGDLSNFSMNYTWGFNTVSKMASPFFSIVNYDLYDEQRSCGPTFMYPSPKEVKMVSKAKGYKKWYKKSIQ